MFASARSAGSTIQWNGNDLVVEEASSADYSGLDAALFSAGATTSLALAPKVASQGVVVVDNSSAWRMDPEVPLVVAGVNDPDIDDRTQGDHRQSQLHHDGGDAGDEAPSRRRRARGHGDQYLSGGLRSRADRLGRTGRPDSQGGDARALTKDGHSIDLGPHEAFVETIAYNALPFAGAMVDDGSFETNEEQKLRDESRKILHIPSLAVSGTCVRVPVFTGHSLSINAAFSRPITVQRAYEILADAPQVMIDEVPTPLKAAGIDPTIVGRIRADETSEHGLALFCSGDNLRKGAALNTIQSQRRL